MKQLLLLFGFFSLIQVYGYKDPLKDIRILYQRSASEETVCEKLIRDLQTYTEKNNPTMAGYKACGMMIMAGYRLNPLQKYATFSEGKGLLEKCIEQDHNNIELRFLRFTVQSNAPSFLQYNSFIDEDKHFILRSVDNLKDAQLRKLIVSFMLQSSAVTPAEKQLLSP